MGMGNLLAARGSVYTVYHLPVCATVAGNHFPELADIVAKVENRTTLKISRKSIFGLLCCCVAFNATTEVRDRFWMKRYGPSRRRALDASAALKIFVRHPENTFATISANSGHRWILV